MRRALALLIAAAIPAAGCGGVNDAAGAGGAGGLDLVAYSTPRDAFRELIPAWQRSASGGAGTGFTQSYGSSGEQSRAVAAGLPADVVALALAPDVDKLVELGIVAPDWAEDPYGGSMTNSVVVFAVRKGNPKGIRTWADLIRPGVEVVTPNPFTSGAARWNVMAAYGAQLELGRSPEQALGYVRALLANTPVQDKSAREALQTFNGGKGDVLLAYENEALIAQAKGLELDYVVPDETIRIENPVAMTTKAKDPQRAKAFVKWLREPEAQRILARNGYRPVRPELADPERYPAPPKLFGIGELGGWEKVNERFFDPRRGAVAAIERDLGVSTAR